MLIMKLLLGLSVLEINKNYFFDEHCRNKTGLKGMLVTVSVLKQQKSRSLSVVLKVRHVKVQGG